MDLEVWTEDKEKWEKVVFTCSMYSIAKNEKILFLWFLQLLQVGFSVPRIVSGNEDLLNDKVIKFKRRVSHAVVSVSGGLFYFFHKPLTWCHLMASAQQVAAARLFVVGNPVNVRWDCVHVMTVYDGGSAFTVARIDLVGPTSRLRTEEWLCVCVFVWCMCLCTIVCAG